MAQVKGVLLNAWVEFLGKRYGEKAVADAIQKLGAEDRALLSSPFLPSSWYSYDTLHSLRSLTRSLMKPGEKRLSLDIGRAMAEYVFTGVYKTFLVQDPVKQVEKFSWIGDFFFQEARKLESQFSSETSCLVRYRYEKGASPTTAICESLVGFWSRLIELSGAKDVKASHTKCIAKQADCCEFTFEWSMPRSSHA
jgi:hypothetical protein